MSGSEFKTERNIKTSSKFEGSRNKTSYSHKTFSQSEKQELVSNIDDMSKADLLVLKKQLGVKSKAKTKAGLKQAVKKELKKRQASDQSSKNIQTGIAAENRVADRFRKKGYHVERVTPNKSTFDGGIPDLKVSKDGRTQFVEVKSVSYKTNDGYGRAQFKRTEIKELAEKNGIVVFEIRQGANRSYYEASAVKVWNRLKDEKGSELKLEYSEIVEVLK